MKIFDDAVDSEEQRKYLNALEYGSKK